jgi:hypothetical protein
MTKADVISKMKSLNLPKGSYVVFGSGPLAAVGIREVNDIDLYVSTEVLQQLKENGWKKVHKGHKDNPYMSDVYEAHDTWVFSPYNPTLADLLSRAFEIDGITFASIEDVRKWKEASGRPKDIVDIERIDKYLSRH